MHFNLYNMNRDLKWPQRLEKCIKENKKNFFYFTFAKEEEKKTSEDVKAFKIYNVLHPFKYSL